MVPYWQGATSALVSQCVPWTFDCVPLTFDPGLLQQSHKPGERGNTLLNISALQEIQNSLECEPTKLYFS